MPASVGNIRRNVEPARNLQSSWRNEIHTPREKITGSRESGCRVAELQRQVLEKEMKSPTLLEIGSEKEEMDGQSQQKEELSSLGETC